jgi:hypothetical protein
MLRLSAPTILAAVTASLLPPGAALAAASTGPGPATAVQARPAAPGAPRLRPGHLPLTFQPNAGQASPSVRYLGQTQGVTTLFTAAGVTVDLARPADRRGPGHGTQARARVTLTFLHASRHPRITGGGRQPGTVNYFTGSNRAGWRTGLPTFAQVVYHGLWPGVTAGFTARDGTLKYWFTVAPHASAGEIQLAYTGAHRITVGKSGRLVVDALGATLGDQAPVSTQTVAGHRSPVTSAYRLAGGTRFGFTVGHRAPGAVLRIDPGLDYGTYLGGSVADSAFSIDTDKAGDVYVFGQTASPNFPITPGAYQTKLSAKTGGTFFVTKLNPAGTGLVYSTFVGGTGFQGLASGVVDSSGDAYVTGESGSTDFPITRGAYRRTPYVSPDQSVVFKLNPTGSRLLYSTYLAPDLISGYTSREIALAGDGSVIVVGGTDSDYAPTTPGAFERTYPGGWEAGYVARLNPAGTGLVYASYLGAELTNQQTLVGADSATPTCLPTAVAAGPHGAAYIAAGCDAGFPTTPGAYQTTAAPAGAALLVKVAPSGRKLDYATYWGNGVDLLPSGDTPLYVTPGGSGVAVDGQGDAYLSADVWSGSVPVTPGAYQSDCAPNAPSAGTTTAPCGGVAEFSPDGRTLLYSSYFGGNQGISTSADTEDIAVDSSGRMYVVGLTSPGMVPITANAYQRSPGHFSLPFYLAVLGKNGLGYATYYGGTGSVCVGILCGVARGTVNVAPRASPAAVYLGGTSEINMPVSQGAFQPTYPGGLNAAWIGKLTLPALPAGG